MTTVVLERVFRMGSIELPDPAPDLEPPVKALRLYSAQYPHLRRATLVHCRMKLPILSANGN